MIKDELIEYIQNYCANEELVATTISSLVFYTTKQKSEFKSIIYEPSLCIALQGEKAVGFGDEMYSYSPSKYLLTCTYIPANIKIQKASNEIPYVSLVIGFSLEEIYEVIKESKQNLQKKVKIASPLCFNTLDENLLEPIARLVKLIEKPKEMADFMMPLIKKEIIYILLQNDPEFLQSYIMEGTIANNITKAISQIKENYNEVINMASLAKTIGISEASLYQNFKKITTMSPLQYQKKIRLEEAKNMLISKNLDAHEVAFAVGYESPSQFSREYTRMYGLPPIAHKKQLQTNINNL